MANKYDITVIGSGPGGLTSALILAKAGYKVLVLEKHFVPGGGLHNFKRKGVKFDTGTHYVGCLDDGQILNQLYKYLGVISDLQIHRLDDDCFDLIRIKDREYRLAQGFENFQNSLINDFPNESKAIIKFTKDIQMITGEADLYNLRTSSDKPSNMLKYMSTNAFEYIQSLTTNRDLQMVLSSLNSLYAGKKESASLYMHAFITHHFIQSAYRFSNGSDELVEILVREIKNHGGVVLTRKEVTGFEYSGKEISAVIANNDERFETKNVISSTHPVQTIRIIEAGRFRNAYNKRISSAPNTFSAFGLNIKLKEDLFPYLNYNTQQYYDDDTWGVDLYDIKTFPQGYFMYTSKVDPGQKMASGLNFITLMDYKEMAKWEDTKMNKRGDDYLAFKHEKSELILDLAEKKYPDLRSMISDVFSFSPLTLRDYLSAEEGGMYGLMPDNRNLAQTYLPVNTKIPNLLFTGQNVNLHGLLGVSMSAVLTCSHFIEMDKMVKDIRNA